jgi:hypothetical protein
MNPGKFFIRAEDSLLVIIDIQEKTCHSHEKDSFFKLCWSIA